MARITLDELKEKFHEEANQEETGQSCQTSSSSEILESEYYVAVLNLNVDTEINGAEHIAALMRMQNTLRDNCAPLYMAPTNWEERDDGITLEIAGKTKGFKSEKITEEFRDENSHSPFGGAQCVYTVNKVREYLENVFGASAQVRPLYTSINCPEDIALMDEVKNLFGGPMGPIRFSRINYPSVEDLVGSGKQQSALLGAQGSFAKKSPYFSAVLVSKQATDEFNKGAYAAAARALNRTTGVVVLPELIFQREDGHWELHIVGSNEARHPFGRREQIKQNDVIEALTFYFDCDGITYELFGTTAADGDDIIEAERIADLVEGCGVPEPEDFVISTKEEIEKSKRDKQSRAKTRELSGEEELEALIGLESVKRQILEFVDYAVAQKERKGTIPSLHLWMTGNPGTGKTTVARIIGHLLYDRGLIPKRNVFVEGDRETLVGQFVGQTAIKTKAAIKRARHGVLFIDEAYALDAGSGKDFGAEAIATLVKAMEDCRTNYEKNGFVCIMAGYPELMEKMVSLNPGLRDRFGFKLEFPDYSADELVEVFEHYAKQEGFIVNPTAKKALSKHMETIVKHKNVDFGNARLVRKIFERCEMRQARLFGPDNRIKKEAIESVFTDSDFTVLEKGFSAGGMGFTQALPESA